MDAASLLAVIRAGRPQFRSRQDKLAYAVHAFLLAQGFKLVAAGPAAEDEAQDWAAPREEVDPTGWDALEGAYAFRYQDTEGARRPLYVKALALGPQLLLHWMSGAAGAASGANASTSRGSSSAAGEPAALELEVDRFTTEAASVADSYAHLGELVTTLTQHMAPALARQGAAAAGAKDAAAPQRTQQDGAGPSGRGQQGQEDYGEEQGRSPLQEGAPRRGGASGIGYMPPPGIAGGVGADDVVPPGFRAPGYGGVGGLGGLMEGPPLGRGGGMHVGPGHPMFGPGRLGGSGGGPPGMDGNGLPPGARWDPIAPPGMPGFRPGDFQHPDPSRPQPDPSRVHPDIMQPGAGRGTDIDAMFG